MPENTVTTPLAPMELDDVADAFAYIRALQADNISDRARSHRDILSTALTAAGLVNYPTEWWHWSYGDRYWALKTGATVAHYGPKELD
jgi:D-alanyl-D-alanine dipeptidase